MSNPPLTCLDCGLLARTERHPGNGELQELSLADRNDFRQNDRRNPLPLVCLGGHQHFHPAHEAIDLRKEIRGRSCDHFEPYQDGRTPKEHQEMIDMREERAWRERQTKLDQEWREKQAVREQEWRQQFMDWQAAQAETQSRREARQDDIQQQRHEMNLERSRIHMRTIMLAAALGAILGGGLNIADRYLSPPQPPPVVKVYPSIVIPPQATSSTSPAASERSAPRQ